MRFDVGSFGGAAAVLRAAALAFTGVAGIACLGSVAACGSTSVQSYGSPKTPVTGISHADYEALLHKYVGDDGKVDYARWKDDAADVQALDAYLSRLTTASPDSRPELFTTQPEKLSYWLNLYNAVVLREILRRWPVDSVTALTVNGTSFVKSGKGFFYELKFAVGGEDMNLYDVENKILRAQFKDARIHFAIACGSSSCPLLRKDAFGGAGLDAQLDKATSEFVNDGKSVVVDDAKKEVVMSKIFNWYADDFTAFTKSRAKVKDAGVVDFALLYADPALAGKLRDAKSKSFKVAFSDYDWTVNKHDGSARTTTTVSTASLGVGKLLPDVEFPLVDSAEGAHVGTWKLSSARGKVVVLDFWATFCIPCRTSFPKLQALHEKHASDGLVIVGISEDDEPSASIPPFVKQVGATFPIALDSHAVASSAPFQVSALPTTLVIDRKGVVRHRHEGARDGEDETIAREVEALLREK